MAKTQEREIDSVDTPSVAMVETEEDEKDDGISPAAERRIRAMEERMREDYERRQAEAATRGQPRVLEERRKTVYDVLGDHQEASRDLTGFEAYNSLMKTRGSVLKAALGQSDMDVKRAFVLGSPANKQRIRDAIYEKAGGKYGVLLDSFMVTPERREMLPALGAGGSGDLFADLDTLGEQVTPPRMAPLHDHGTELEFQSLVNKDITWGELSDDRFIAVAELYADRHPDYKNSEEFEAISARAFSMRQKMALELSAEGRMSYDMGNRFTMSIMEGVRAALPAPEQLLLDDEEQMVRNTARTLYHLEGEDFAVAKPIGLMAGMLTTYGFAYSKLAKHGLTRVFGESAKQKTLSLGSMALVEAGINTGYNWEGHSLISQIFNEGEPNKLLSYAEAILIGGVFHLGIDKVRQLAGMKRHQVAGYLEDRLPYSKNELAIIDPKNPPPGWHKLPKPSEKAGAINAKIHKLNKRIEEGFPTHLAGRAELRKATEKLDALKEELGILSKTPDDVAAFERTVGRAWGKAGDKSVPRLETKQQLLLSERSGVSEAVRMRRLIENNAVRHDFLKNRAVELRTQARSFITAGRREEGLALFRKAKDIDAERLAIKSTSEMPLGPRVARRQEAEARAGFVEDISRPSGKELELQNLVDHVVAGQARHNLRIRHVDESLRATDDVISHGTSEFKALIDDIPDDVMDAMRAQVARMSRPLEVYEQTIKADAARLRKIIHESQEVLETSNQRIALAKAAAEQAEVVAAKAAKAPARAAEGEVAAKIKKLEEKVKYFVEAAEKVKGTAGPKAMAAQLKKASKASAELDKLREPKPTKGATVTPIKGGLRVEGTNPWVQQGYADIANRELFNIPHVARELAYRAGFGNLVGMGAEDEGYDFWPAFLWGFTMFNPQFARIRGYNLGVRDYAGRARASQKGANYLVEQIGSALEKIHPRLLTRLMRYETISGGQPVLLKNKGHLYFRTLDEAVNQGIINDAKRAAMSNMWNDIGSNPRMREEVARVGKLLAEDRRSMITYGGEFTDQFNTMVKIKDGVKDAFIKAGGELGEIEYHGTRWVKHGKLDAYRKALGIEKESVIGEYVRGYEKQVLGRKLNLANKADKKLRKQLANSALKDLNAGMRSQDPTKARKLERIKPEHAHFYEPDAVGWGRYIDSMVEKTERLKLLGAPRHTLSKGSKLKPPTVGTRELDDTVGGILTSLRYPDRVLPQGTVIRYADGTKRTLTEDTFFNKFQIGEDVKLLAKGEERRLSSEVAETRSKITIEQEDMVRDLFAKRFAGGRRRIGPGVQIARAATHALTIGNFSSTVTQTGDMGLIMTTEGTRAAGRMFGDRTGKVFNDAMRWMTKGKYNKATSENLVYARKEFNLGDLGMEMFDGAGDNVWAAAASKSTKKILKYTGFTAYDGMLKEVKLNATLLNLRKGIKVKIWPGGRTTYKVSPEIRARFGAAFGDDFDDLVKAVANKDWGNWNLRTAVLMELGKIQPITLSNMPAAYIAAGGLGRFCYTLKTFQMTYFNHLRRTVLSKLWRGAKKTGNPKTRAAGIKEMKEGGVNLTKLMVYFGGTTFGTNMVKDIINGREFSPVAAATDAFATAWGLSRYQFYDFRRRMQHESKVMGAIHGVVQLAVPAGISVASSMLGDTYKIMQGESWKKIESLKYVPIGGKFLHGWAGAGKQREKERKAKERKAKGGKGGVLPRGSQLPEGSQMPRSSQMPRGSQMPR